MSVNDMRVGSREIVVTNRHQRLAEHYLARFYCAMSVADRVPDYDMRIEVIKSAARFLRLAQEEMAKLVQDPAAVCVTAQAAVLAGWALDLV